MRLWTRSQAQELGRGLSIMVNRPPCFVSRPRNSFPDPQETWLLPSLGLQRAVPFIGNAFPSPLSLATYPSPLRPQMRPHVFRQAFSSLPVWIQVLGPSSLSSSVLVTSQCQTRGCDFDSWQTTTSPVARAIPGKSFAFLDARVLLWESFRQEHAWEDLLFRISRFWLIPWERSRKLVQVQ